MDGDRVCEIYLGTTRCGSGYVVSDTMVVTAAHVVRRTGESVRVRRFHGSGLAVGEVVWLRWDKSDGVDIALVRITDPAWQLPADLGPVRWGRLVTTETTARAVGYPRVQRLVDPDGKVELRDLEDLTCHVSPVTTGKVGTLGLSVTTSLPLPTPDDEPSPWAGMSGAALFCGPVLIGVITLHPDGFDTSRLTAVPVTRLLGDPAAVALLDARPTVEPAELVPLATQVSPVNSPAWLLRADVEVVAFRGRDELLVQLRDWCTGPGRYSARLLSGPGGQGKTRLARELGHRMSDAGWTVLHVVPDSDSVDRYAVLADVSEPLLVVIDYAETRVQQAGAVMQALHDAKRPVRLLLVARTGGAWVKELAAARPALDSVIGESLVEIVLPERPTSTAVPVPVPELADTLAEREAMFADAVISFADSLALLPAYRHVDWAAVASAVTRPDLADPRYDTALSVQLAALAGLLDPQDTTSPPEEVLLRHEQRYWGDLAAIRGVTALPDFERLSYWLVAVAVVCAADTEQEALDTLATLPILAGGSGAMPGAVARWLHDLYPAQHAYWGTPQPDRLAEYLAASVLADKPDLFDPVLPAATDSQLYRALIVLSRAAINRPPIDATLRRLITEHPIALAPSALSVSIAVENPQPLEAAVDALVDRPEPDPDLLMRLFQAIPWNSRRHRRRGARIAELSVEHYRRADAALRRANPRRYRWRPRRLTEASPELAAWLIMLATSHSELGEWEDAAAASAAGLSLLDRLMRENSGTYDTDLAEALTIRCLILDALGRRTEALAAVRQAIAAFAALADREPGKYDAAISAGRAAEGLLLMRLGDWDQARACFRAATQTVGDVSQTTVAAAAAEIGVNLGGTLAQLGLHEEAATVAREAVARYRQLAADFPDVYESMLAPALVNLSKVLFELQELDEAVAAAVEAVDWYRGLADDYPDVYRQYKLLALANLAGLSLYRKVADGLAAAAEAVAGFRKLIFARPGVFENDFVVALTNLAALLSEAGQSAEAMKITKEAVAISRAKAEGNPAVFRPLLARSLINLAARLFEDDRTADASAVVNEAVVLLRALAERDPTAHAYLLVTALGTQSELLTDLGRWEQARTLALEAIRLCRTYAHPGLNMWEDLLGLALVNHGKVLTKLDRHADALTADREALEIRQRLVERAPTTFAEALIDSTGAVVIDYAALRQPVEALATWQDTTERLRQLPGQELAYSTALFATAYRLSVLDRNDEALESTLDVLAIRRACGDTPERIAATLDRLAVLYRKIGRLDDAITAQTEEVAIRRELAVSGVTNGSELADDLVSLAHEHLRMGQVDELEATSDEAVTWYRRLVGEGVESAKTGLPFALNCLGVAHAMRGDIAVADGAYREARDLLRPLAAAGDEDSRAVLAVILLSLAEVATARAANDEVLDLTAEAIPVLREMCSDDADRFGASLGAILLLRGQALLAVDQPRPAHTALAEAVRILATGTSAEESVFIQNTITTQLDAARDYLAAAAEILDD